MAKGKYKSNFRIEDIQSVEWVKLQSYVSSARGGIGNYVDDDLDVEFVPNINDFDEDKNTVLTIVGDSMSPVINDKDKVIIYVSGQENYRRGDIVACYLNGDFIIKVFEPSSYHIMLVSINPDHEPIRITEEDTLKIIGRAVYVMRKL